MMIDQSFLNNMVQFNLQISAPKKLPQNYQFWLILVNEKLLQTYLFLDWKNYITVT